MFPFAMYSVPFLTCSAISLAMVSHARSVRKARGMCQTLRPPSSTVVIEVVAPCVWPALRRAVRPLPDSCGAANIGYLDENALNRHGTKQDRCYPIIFGFGDAMARHWDILL